MSARALVIGLDGADLGLIERLGADALPNLHRAMGRGCYAALQSLQPPATLPNWLGFLTGVGPGKHGVFDFTTRAGYDVRFTAGTTRRLPTIIQRLDDLGLKCACLAFPGTFPPERLARGVFLSGWDAPVAFQADPSFVWPRWLHRALRQRFGPLRFDDVDEFQADRAGWHASLGEKLEQRIHQKLNWSEWLLRSQSWDVFAVYFGESDTAAHHLWSLHDSDSPRRPERVSAQEQFGLERVYRALDRAVGQLWQAAGGDGVELTILSDHGFGGASDKVVYLNQALAEAGLLHFKPSRFASRLTSFVKQLALRRLHPALREAIFRAQDAWLPSWLESRARFGAIDMARTQAFSDELNYFPAVHLNVRGREPQGTILPEDVPAARRRVIEALLALRDPWTQRPIVARVHEREELFSGPATEQAPDLVLQLELDPSPTGGGYSYNLQPSPAVTGATAFARLASDEYLGRKGRSLPGSHRATGFFAASGPLVANVGRIEASITDVTATLLARLKVAVPSSFDGRILREALSHKLNDAASGGPHKSRVAELSTTEGRDFPASSSTHGDASLVEARLRALGYVE